MSKLSGCLEYDPEPYRHEYAKDQNARHRDAAQGHARSQRAVAIPNRHLHYNDVAREFETLGAEEFDRRYYNERVVKRIILAKAQLRGGNPNMRGGNGIKGRRPYDPERDQK